MTRLSAACGLAISLSLTGLSALVQAQPVNKCIDAAGKVTYSQGPCPGAAKSTRLAPPPLPPASAAGTAAGGADKAAKSSPPKTAAELEQEFRKRRADAEKAAQEQQKKAAETEERQENCKLARGQLANLESGGRQMRTDERGERVFLDDAQIEREKERARRAIEQNCK